jgi:2'-5' RNA ligase
MNTKRLFIAINLPGDIRNILSDFSLTLGKNFQGVSWVKPSNYHLTLVFLGEVGANEQVKIKSILDSLSIKFGKIKFSLDEISAFPDKKNARVIFIVLNEINGDKAYHLHKEIKFQLESRGLPTENKKWTPHITLGRVKTSGVNLKDLPVKKQQIYFEVNSIELMESKLKPTGAVYNMVYSVKL